MGWKAVGSAQDAIRGLVEKGWLFREGTGSRNLRFVESLSFRRIPILGSAPAGLPVEAIEAHQGDLAIPDRFDGPHFALKVQGDSMKDAGIDDQDLVIVRQSPEAEHKDIVVAMEWNQVTIKRLLKRSRSLWLKPENPKYPEWKVSDPDFRVLGKVVGLHRYWN
jgi:repressor LexA